MLILDEFIQEEIKYMENAEDLDALFCEIEEVKEEEPYELPNDYGFANPTLPKGRPYMSSCLIKPDINDSNTVPLYSKTRKMFQIPPIPDSGRYQDFVIKFPEISPHSPAKEGYERVTATCGNNTVYVKHLASLGPGSWLHDSMIDAELAYMEQELGIGKEGGLFYNVAIMDLSFIQLL